MKSKLFRKWIIRFLIGTLLLMSFNFSAFAEEGDPSAESVLPPMAEVELPPTDSYGFVDEESQGAIISEAADYPEAYDMRDYGYITSVKLQNPFGSCWAFAAIAAAESSIISSGLAAEDGLDATTLNLSERHLSIFTSTSVKDPSSRQYGEGFKDDGISASGKLQKGGYSFLASNVFASGAGPVMEADDPDLIYQGRNGIIEYRYFEGALKAFSYSADDDWDIPYEKRNAKSYSLKESYVLPTPAVLIDPGMGAEYWEYSYNEAATAAIKKQLLAGRAVEIGFQADQASPNDETEPVMLSNNWAHYGIYMGFANHAVTIVGWDDRYPKENFIEGNQPPENGAWLVKNSWGSGEEEFPNKAEGTWGLLQGQDKYPFEATSDIHTGYFWLSYYDHSLSFPEAVEFEQTDEDLIMDAYDYMCANSLNATEYEEEARMANVFRASVHQKVTQISFQTTHPNTTVYWQVYLMEGDEDHPDGGILKAEGEATYEFGGFHKVELGEDAFPVAHGQFYSIVITETLPDGRYTVNIPIQDITTHTGVINSSESRVYLDGYWQDLEDKDLQQELAADPTQPELLPGEDPLRAVDNFSIKGYAVPLDCDLSFSLAGSTLLKFVDKHDSATIKLRVGNYGTTESLQDTGNWTIKWSLPDELNMIGFQKDLVTITPSADGFSAKIAGRKVDGDCLSGSSMLCADIYAEDGEYLGSALADITIYTLFMESLLLKDRTKEYYYTGEEIRPEVVAYTNGSPGILLKEGVDYTLAYEDNIQCGAAKIIATAMGDIQEGQALNYFPIRPVKAEIESLTAGKGSLTVKVKDQSESGLTGYQIQYRKQGESDWKTLKIGAAENETRIKGLEMGEQYEVKASGYVYISDEYGWLIDEGDYYGKESEIVVSDPIADLGPMKNGWNSIEESWYYQKADGTLAKGWLKDGNTWYYMDLQTGEMKTGWVKDGSTWYYMKASGAMATGWVKDGNNWYYMKSSGAMATGWIKDGNIWYYLKSSGAMAASEWVTGYYWISANGTWTYQPVGSWKQNNTGWWFGDTSGWYAKNETIKIDNVDYAFDEAGYWIEDTIIDIEW